MRNLVKSLAIAIAYSLSSQALALGPNDLVIESPVNNSICTGITSIHGFAGSNIKEVSISIDGSEPVNLAVTGSRTDVTPNDSNGQGPGWSTVFNCGILESGSNHELVVSDRNGNTFSKLSFSSIRLAGQKFVTSAFPSSFRGLNVVFNGVSTQVTLTWNQATQRYEIVEDKIGEQVIDPIVDPSVDLSGLKAVNELRASGVDCGGEFMPAVPPLVWNDKLSASAKVHARDLADNIPDSNFGHIGSNGSTGGDRISDAGYVWITWGENADRSPISKVDGVRRFKDSPPHCKAMMGVGFKEYGDSYQSNPNSKWIDYMVQNFATSN